MVVVTKGRTAEPPGVKNSGGFCRFWARLERRGTVRRSPRYVEVVSFVDDLFRSGTGSGNPLRPSN